MEQLLFPDGDDREVVTQTSSARHGYCHRENVAKTGCTMNADSELLRRYADRGDQSAFAELVRRQVNLVYSAALRQLNGDAQLAQDAAQLVFADLARKAGALASHQVLSGWLFTSTRYAAAKLARSERRRRTRETVAHSMTELNSTAEAPADWHRVRPVLDEAMADLSAAERDALLLRFFESCGYAEVGARLELGENTARMRVDRALGKLRQALARRGVTSTEAALATALASQGVLAAPSGLAGTIAGAVLATTGVTAATTLMTMAKLSLGVLGGALVGGVGGWWMQAAYTAPLEQELAQVRQAVPPSAAALPQQAVPAEPAPPAGAELDRLATEATALRAELQGGETRTAVVSTKRSKTSSPGYDYADVDVKPTPTFRKPPQYPKELREKRVEGEASVRFLVTADGRVAEVSVVRATHEAFGEAAADAVQEWRFDAGQKDGVPVGVWLEQPISFSLPKDEPAERLL